MPILSGFSQFGVSLVVGGQEQKHFSPLGTKLYFFVNYSRKNPIVLTPKWPPCHMDANQENAIGIEKIPILTSTLKLSNEFL